MPATNDYRFESADNEVAMTLNRESSTVNVTLRFSDATKIANVVIEKSNDATNNFSRCGYIGFDRSTEVVIVKKRDNYPLSSTLDAFYRLRLSFTDGSERVYPPVRLPAVVQ